MTRCSIGTILLLTLVVLAAISLLDSQAQANSDLAVLSVGIHQEAQIDSGDVREYPLLTRQEHPGYSMDNLYKNELTDQAITSDGIDVKTATAQQRQKLNCPLPTASASYNLKNFNRTCPLLT